jgi:hypothetical protein
VPGDLTQPETSPAALFGVDRAFLFPAFNGCTPAPESCPTWTATASSTPTASPKGVYAGTLLIGALIEGSEAHRNASASGGDRHVAVVPAEDLAERHWDMYLKRDRVEEEVAPALAASNVGLLSVLGMLMFHDFLAQFSRTAPSTSKSRTPSSACGG